VCIALKDSICIIGILKEFLCVYVFFENLFKLKTVSFCSVFLTQDLKCGREYGMTKVLLGLAYGRLRNVNFFGALES